MRIGRGLNPSIRVNASIQFSGNKPWLEIGDETLEVEIKALLRSEAHISPLTSRQSGGDSGGDTRVPIPNTTVKPSSADGTWGAGPWESRPLPGVFYIFLRSSMVERSAVNR